VKRTFSLLGSPAVLVGSGTALIAATYGLVRLAYGLFLPDVQHTIGLGDGAAGWIASGSSIVYCVGAVIGFLVAPARPRSAVVLAVLTAGLGAAGMATSTGPLVFGAAAVVSSAGAGLASPALVRLVQRNLSPERVNRAQAVVNSGTGPGLVAAGTLALVLLPDWRTAWVVAAVVTVVAGAAVLLADRAGTAAATSNSDADADTSTTATAATAATGALPPLSWHAAHRRPVVVALLLGAGSAAVWTYGRSLLIDAGATTTLSVGAWISIGIGGAAVALTSGWLGRLPARTAWARTAATVALGTIGLGALGLAPQLPGVLLTTLALTCCALFGWGYTAATGALITWTTELDRERAAAGTSVLFVVLVLGQAVGAAVAGTAVRAVGTGPVFVAAAAVVALGVVPALGSPRRRPAVEPMPLGGVTGPAPRDV
jgi:predicted MFS family arabinose efflux permease